MMHQAFFYLSDPGNAASREELIAGVRTLEAIPQVHSLRIFVPAATENRDVVDADWAVHECIEFASLADQATYQTHPIHLDFIARCEHLWERVAVFDGQEV